MTVAITDEGVDIDLAMEHLGQMWGEAEGYGWLARCTRGEVVNGRPEAKGWTQESLEWPAQRDDVRDYIETHAMTHELFFCPFVHRSGDSKRKGASVERRWVCVDQDRPMTNPDALSPTLVVESGTQGHSHLYYSVPEGVGVDEYQALAKGIGELLGCGNDKTTEEGFLRVPGTLNFEHDPPTVCEVVERTDATYTQQGLSVAVNVRPSAHTHDRVIDAQERSQGLQFEDVPDMRRNGTIKGQPKLNTELGRIAEGGDKSAIVYAAVKECLKFGYMPGQVATIIRRHPAMDFAADRFDTDADLLRDVGRIAGKVSRDNVGDGFWDSRPVLAHVRDFARARMVSPWSLLGVVLARTVAVIPPEVVLPPTVGSYASMNLAVALVGKSGGGKGGSMQAAREVIDFGVDIHTATVGSGEGIAKQYAYRRKEALVTLRESVLFSVEEIDTVASLASRNGSTLLPELRKAWMGEELGFSNSDPMRSIPVKAHRYRLSVVMGVQPENASVLLDDQAGGTPQRFIWLPVTDPGAPDGEPDCPETRRHPLTPEADRDMVVDEPRPVEELRVLEIPQVAVRTMREARRAHLREEGGNPLDSHTLLTRLKVAGALMWLDGRTSKVTDDDWCLAGKLMKVSDDTRKGMQEVLARIAREKGEQKAKAQGRNAAVAEDAREQTRVQGLADNIVKKLEREGGSCTQNTLKKALSRNACNEHFEEAVALLEGEGRIEAKQVKQGGTRYTLT